MILTGLNLDRIGWLIAGLKSGPRHRRLDGPWVRDLRDRCAREDDAFFFKQGADADRNPTGGSSTGATGREPESEAGAQP